MFRHYPFVGFPCGCLGLAAALAASVFWIWALVDCAMKERESTNKIVWVLVILFTHFLGAILYVLIRRPERIREIGR
jgi:hypothetical protein